MRIETELLHGNSHAWLTEFTRCDDGSLKYFRCNKDTNTAPWSCACTYAYVEIRIELLDRQKI